jgi:hypothetical protein
LNFFNLFNLFVEIFRYLNTLDPKIRKGKFNNEEDRLLIEGIRQYGARWKLIALKIGKRTENMVKNRWHSHLKKLMKKNQPEELKTLLGIIKAKNRKKFEEELQENPQNIEKINEKREKVFIIEEKEKKSAQENAEGIKRIVEEKPLFPEGLGWEMGNLWLRRQLFWEELLLMVMTQLQGKM